MNLIKLVEIILPIGVIVLLALGMYGLFMIQKDRDEAEEKSRLVKAKVRYFSSLDNVFYCTFDLGYGICWGYIQNLVLPKNMKEDEELEVNCRIKEFDYSEKGRWILEVLN